MEPAQAENVQQDWTREDGLTFRDKHTEWIVLWI